MPFPILARERGHEFVACDLSPWMNVDRRGSRQHRLTVIRPMRHRSMKCIFWECRCDCGELVILRASSFKAANLTKSCGCQAREAVSSRQSITGLSRSRTYRIWCHIIERCDNPKSKAFHNYGGRGISYDPRWRRFENFLADMGIAPDGLEIDRRDNDGHYCKDNCRWVTSVVNQNNRRNNRLLEYRGQKFTMSQLARESGISFTRLKGRIDSGWSVDDAVSAPQYAFLTRSPKNGRFESLRA